MRNYLKDKRIVWALAVPMLIALIARITLFNSWLDSPIRFYSYVSGLDMPTILFIGSWLYNGFSIFTLYKFTIAMIMYFNSGQHCPEVLIIIQLLMGIGISGITAWITLKLSGKWLWAAVSGILAALYAPGMIYEVLVLKEIYLTFFSLLALAFVIWGRNRHYKPWIAFLTGIGLALPCLCRVTALPFCCFAGLWMTFYLFNHLRRKSKKWYKPLIFRILCAIAGVLVIFVPVTIFNYYNSSKRVPLPFHVGASYAVSLGKVKSPSSMNVKIIDLKSSLKENSVQKKNAEDNSQSPIVNFMSNFSRKLPLVFNQHEIPNNVNYFFMKDKLLPIKYMPGPSLLLPLAITALLLIIFSGRFLRRESLLLIYIIAFLFPICFFYPLGRYRLVLFPVFCMLAPYPFYFAWKLRNRYKNILILLPIPIIYAVVFMLSFPTKDGYRASDFIAYGKALEKKDRNPMRAIRFYRTAIKMRPDYQPAIINYCDSLLKTGQPQRAAALIMPHIMKNPQNNAYLYYGALAKFYSRQPAEAESLLRRIPISQGHPLAVQYYYYLGETMRVQKKYKQALAEYQRALKCSPNASQGKMIINSVKWTTAKLKKH
jgi:hypothetical protein